MIYKLEIRSENFQSDVICMGWQLSQILKAFISLSGISWAIYDIYGSTNSNLFKLFPKDKFDNIFFKNTADLISSVNKIHQFESGVFCLVDKNKKIKFLDDVPETESDEGIQVKNALLEIRAFDYTYFEVYSEDLEFLERIKIKLPNGDDLTYKKIKS